MSKLTICIPTFNRAAVLEANLAHLEDLAERHDIVVQVSDNCSTDATREVAIAAARRCPRIFYHCNPTNIGMDGNFAKVLALPNTSYAWLLGDDDLISELALCEVLALIESEVYDLVLVNGGSVQPEAGRVQNEPSRNFDDPERLMTELGWHATWISGLVIGRRLRQQMRVEAYAGTYFSHFIALFEALKIIPSPRIRWHAPSSFHTSHLTSFSWSERVVEIFAARWSHAVWSIPGDYSAPARRVCVRAHGVRSGLLTKMGLLNMRAIGGLNLVQARRYRKELIECSPCPWWQIVAICSMPKAVLRPARAGMLALRSFRAGDGRGHA